MTTLTPLAPIQLIALAPCCCRDCPSARRIGDGIRALWLIGDMTPDDVEDIAEQACAGCATQRAQAHFGTPPTDQVCVKTYIWVRLYPDGDHRGPITHGL